MSTLELARRMQDIGHEVLIVDLWGANEDFNLKVKQHGLNYEIIKPRERPLVISSPDRLKSIRNAAVYLFVQMIYRRRLKSIVSNFSPDVVSVNNIKCLSLLDSNSSYRIEFFARTWFAQKDLSLRARVLFKKYRPRFLAVSQATRQAIYTGGLAPLPDIKVLHSVIDEKVFSQYEPKHRKFCVSDPIRILHSGGLLPEKGQQLLIEIARRLKEQSVPFKLVLTGVIYTGSASSAYYHKIKGLIHGYGLAEDIEIVLNNFDVQGYFRDADILVHPSYSEGLPRVALEALCYGKPVIANAVGGVTDVVIHNHTGFLTDFNDIDQYVGYITSYFDSQLYKRHSQNARDLIRSSYLSANQYEMIEKIYPVYV